MRSFFGPVLRADHFTAAPVLRSPPIFSSSASAPANRVTCGDRNAGALIKSKGCDRTSDIEWPRFRARVKCRPQHRDSAIVYETLQDSIVGPRAQIQFRHRNWNQFLLVPPQFAMRFQMARGHTRIATRLRVPRKAFLLLEARARDSFADHGRMFLRSLARNIADPGGQQRINRVHRCKCLGAIPQAAFPTK
jgi:hypothetical protein